MKQHGNQLFGLKLRRLLSGLLCAVMLCGLLPAEPFSLAGSAQAAEATLAWSNEDLETLRRYDIMRGYEDNQMHPERTIRRSEFAAMINRALSYTEKASKNPFRDVNASDWFFDDISISYNMGYMGGTSATAMSPNGTLTRQEALVILGRNLMLQPSVGESFSYADTRSFGNWSRGYIDPAIEAGIIDADRTGNFNPQKAITRGEVAGMIVRAIGSRISSPGITSLGTVNENVTITSSNVTLRNTTINGDLYLTGGIGLGNVLLDNVTVNGKIVDSGAGQSEKGEISVILNNVSANELIVDSMSNKLISLSARGTTDVPKTSLRTSARVEDSTATGYGLRLIEIDGEPKTAATLSGNIKEAVNKTPESTLNIGEGVAEKITVDEAAVNSSVSVGKDARIKYLNLDTGAKVTGTGVVDSLTISANGTTVTLPQLPDEVVIAPGITSNLNRQQYDSAAAQELSSRPRFMPGYPVADNLTPTSANVLLSVNKPGTVYWTVTAKSVGSPGEEDIISPPSYAGNILKSGSVRIRTSNQENTARVSGLTSDGSYYFSAILVDERGTRSAIKVIPFDTPDNTTPAFAKDYPTIEASEKDAQLAAMTTKDCYLYYTVLPKGSTAPRAIDFQTGSISGNLGYGMVKMAKNSPAYIFVNDISLGEKQPYVLYLWLTDLDGAKSSAVKSMNFTTQDKTDPIISNLRQTKSTTTSVTASYMLNEPGTLYWAVVKAGDRSFMSPTTSGSSASNQKWLESREAMERVIAGTGALKSGKSAVAASKVGADVSFTVSSLSSKTTGTSSYDLYYVAVDAAGNWSKPIRSVTVYTEDKTAPTVAQKFTSFGEGETEDTTRPLANTNIRLVFSKPVRAVEEENGVAVPYNLLDTAQPKLGEILRKYVLMYVVPSGGGTAVRAVDRKDDNINWVIDYDKARVYQDASSMVVEFPNNTVNSANSALRLANGATYYFVVSPQRGDFQDTTANHNEMSPTTLPRFTTMPAQINISEAQGVGSMIDNVEGVTGELEADFKFQFQPQSTSTAPSGVYYDIMIWCNTNLKFDLYMRTKADSENTWTKWKKQNTTPFDYSMQAGATIYRTLAGVNNDTKYTNNVLNTNLDENTIYQYAVNITAVGDGNLPRKSWNIDPEFRVTVASGSVGQLGRLANRRLESDWKDILADRNSDVESIGNPDPYIRTISISDTVPPVLSGSFPMFTDILDHSATMNFALNNKGTIYYVVTPVVNGSNSVPGTLANGTALTNPGLLVDKDPNDGVDPGQGNPAVDNTTRGDYVDNVPLEGTKIDHDTNADNYDDQNSDLTHEAILASPGRSGIISTTITDPNVRQGNVYYNGTESARVNLDDLQAGTWYYVYLMFEGNRTSERAVVYKFRTSDPIRPILSLQTTETDKRSGSVTATVNGSSGNVTARLVPTSELPTSVFSLPFNMKANGKTADGRENPVKKDFLKDTNTPYENNNTFTILDAMSNSVGSTGTASVFDTYASSYLQNYIANLIKNGFGGSVAKWPASGSSQLIRKDQTASMTFTLPDPNVKYFCVALAENTTPGANHGFSAHPEVQIVDDVKPSPDNLSGELTLVRTPVTSETTSTQRTYQYTLKGTLTVQYSNILYRYDSISGQALPFTQAGQPDLNGKQNPLGAFNYTNGVSTEVDQKPSATNPLVAQWYGVKNLYVRDGVTVVTTGGVPQMNNEFTISVELDLGTRTSYKTEEPMLDGSGKPILDKDGDPIMKEVWSEIVEPRPNGTISLPSDFRNRSNLPAEVNKKISYTTDNGGNVTVKLTK